MYNTIPHSRKKLLNREKKNPCSWYRLSNHTNISDTGGIHFTLSEIILNSLQLIMLKALSGKGRAPSSTCYSFILRRSFNFKKLETWKCITTAEKCVTTADQFLPLVHNTQMKHGKDLTNLSSVISVPYSVKCGAKSGKNINFDESLTEPLKMTPLETFARRKRLH